MRQLKLVLLLLLLFVGCSSEEGMVEKFSVPTYSDVTSEDWKKLSDKKIYFGHQSVGENIIDGIHDVMKNNKEIQLSIKESKSSSELDKVNILHSSIGKNGDPVGKIVDFKKQIDNGIGEKVDIAFVKLCFWDIQKNTDVNKIFSEYKLTIADLRESYPDTHFMHMTVPLMSHSDSLINRLKRIIREDNGDLANIKRNELNDLILNEYKDKEPVFDIAKFESTQPDGSRVYFIKDGKKYYYLPDLYTEDGGHLNMQGRRFIAEQMLIKLADIAKE